MTYEPDKQVRREKMRRIALMLCLLLCTATFLLAEEFVIRPADKLTLAEYSFQTADGDWIVFFSDHSTFTESIFYYKISATGELITSEAAPLAYKETDQKLVNMIPTSDGNFIIVWQEVSNNNHVYMQKLNPDCQNLWANEGVKCLDSFPESYRYRMLANDVGGITVASQTEYWNSPICAQNFDSQGNKLWGEDDVVLVGSGVRSAIGDIVPYPGGGFLLHFWIGYASCEVWRYSESGLLVDDDSFVPTDLFFKGVSKIVGPVNGEYLIYGDYDSMLEINKVSASGELLLDQNLVYYSSYLCGIKLLSDGRVAMLLNYGSADGTADTARLYMLSADLEVLWIVEEQIPRYQQLRICVLPEDKILLTWGRTAQIYDASGTHLLGEPQVISGDSGYGMLILPANDTVTFLWNYKYNVEQRIKLQAMNMDGSLVHLPNGVILEMRLAGTCPDGYSYHGKGENHCFTFGDRFLSIWTDTRSNEHLFFQLFDQDMHPLLEPNGRAVHPYSINSPILVQSYISEDNKFHLIYKPRYWDPKYLQAIDYEGNLCYDGNGLEIQLPDSVVGNAGHVTYVFWTVDTVGRSNKIMGQKYVNGQAQWSEVGGLILPNVYSHKYTLLGFENGLLIYSDGFYSYQQEGPAFLRALKFDANGLISNEIITLSSEPISLEAPLSAKGMMGDDLCLIVRRESEESVYSYILQKVDSHGNRLWGEAGISLGSSGAISHATFGDIAANFLTLDDIGYALHSVSAEGIPQTPYGGIVIIPIAYTPKEVDFATFEDGSMICVFSDDHETDPDIYIRLMDEDGMPMDAAPLVLCDARNIQSQPRITTYSNRAFITWKDHRAGVGVTGLWGNTVHSSTPNDDALQTPIQQAQIIGNYPNPFNPSTTISYQIAADGMAKLDIYNIKGQLVKSLLNEPQTRGRHQVMWSGKNIGGKDVASGIYFVRLSSAGRSSIHKMVLMK
jgi:hypothetical protein